MLAAVVLGALLLRRSQAALPLTWRERGGLALGAFCGAMIGAKLPFALADSQGVFSGLAWLAHGKTILAGLVGAYLGVEIAKWSLDIRVRTGDSFAVPAAVAVAVGRIACFFGGCCHGTPTTLPWGVVFPITGDGLPRHPTQLYEAGFHLAAAALLGWLGARGLLRGQLIKLYLLLYLGYRFGTEFIRPEVPLWLGLTGYQWGALALAALFAWLWWRDARAMAREQDFALQAARAERAC
jgi:phosphatidylglycerol:prolipoprotein diacylglycerol transferase